MHTYYPYSTNNKNIREIIATAYRPCTVLNTPVPVRFWLSSFTVHYFIPFAVYSLIFMDNWIFILNQEKNKTINV